MAKRNKGRTKKAKRSSPTEGCHHIPPTSYDAMKQIFPGLETVVKSAVKQFRESTASDRRDTIPSEFILGNEDLQRFLEDYQRDSVVRRGFHPADVMTSANLLGHHLEYMINYELHHRKAFWVDQALAWMLGQTNLDVEGDLLRLPFPSFAVIFTDRETLEAVDALVRKYDSDICRPGGLKIITVHITNRPQTDDSIGMNISILPDWRFPGDWPYLLSRELNFKPTDNLAAILQSSAPDVSRGDRDPIFGSDEMKKLVHLIINTILYATSAHLDSTTLKSPIRNADSAAAQVSRRAHIDSISKEFTSEDVFHLPGKINISQLRQLKALERSGNGNQIMKRFMVRGHWRRPAENWHEQRPIWIQPYWKGPDMAVAIDREYRLKP